MRTFVHFVLFCLVIYFVVAMLTFRVRHPWATEMETWMNVHHALLFEKVPYAKMRERY